MNPTSQVGLSLPYGIAENRCSVSTVSLNFLHFGSCKPDRKYYLYSACTCRNQTRPINRPCLSVQRPSVILSSASIDMPVMHPIPIVDFCLSLWVFDVMPTKANEPLKDRQNLLREQLKFTELRICSTAREPLMEAQCWV